MNSFALAHEFWIEPLDFQLEPDNLVVANLKVGENMSGDVFPYLPQRFVEFSIRDPQGTRLIEEPLGAIPAVSERALRPGLHTLTYHSEPSQVSYDSFEKFETFLHEEDLEGIVEAHRRRELPESGFTEAFIRYAKALVQVGDGAGQDSPIGMPLELVAETNPYIDKTEKEVSVRLLWQGQGMPDTQVKVFRRTAQGEVTLSKVSTGSEGRVAIARNGGGLFMLSAVHMVEPAKETGGKKTVVWQSLWASLTFRLME